MTDDRSVLVLRHGQTDGNALRIVQTPDTPLNDAGLEQAELLARRVDDEIGRQLVIVSSDYLRARQTAEAVARATGATIRLEPLLRERNFGTFRGRRYADLEVDPFAPDVHPPGGESWGQFDERVARLWGRLPRWIDEHPPDTTLVLVTHGLVCRGLSAHYLAEPVDQWGNTSLTRLRRAGGSWSADPLNCCLHLDGLDNPALLSGL